MEVTDFSQIPTLYTQFCHISMIIVASAKSISTEHLVNHIQSEKENGGESIFFMQNFSCNPSTFDLCSTLSAMWWCDSVTNLWSLVLFLFDITHMRHDSQIPFPKYLCLSGITLLHSQIWITPYYTVMGFSMMTSEKLQYLLSYLSEIWCNESVESVCEGDYHVSTACQDSLKLYGD